MIMDSDRALTKMAAGEGHQKITILCRLEFCLYLGVSCRKKKCGIDS